MIDLTINESTDTHVVQESILGDSLKSAGGIDPGKIKEEWQNADNAAGKIKAVNDEGLDKANKALGDVDKWTDKYRVNNSSIIARARNSVLQFPIYVTQTLRVNEAHIIAKSFERVYATLVQTVLSQNLFIDENEANNLVFLKNFHTNLKENADMVYSQYENLISKYYESIDDFDQMMCDSILCTHKITENCTVEFRVVPTTNEDLILENARLLNDPLSGLFYLREEGNTETVHESEKSNTVRVTVISNEDFRSMAINELNLSQADIRLINTSEQDIRSDINEKRQSSFPEKPTDNASKDEKDKYSADVIKWKSERDDAVSKRIEEKHDLERKIDDEIDSLKSKIRDKKLGSKYDYKNGRYIKYEDQVTSKTKDTTRPKNVMSRPVDSAIDTPKLLKDGDIKKINGMLPYTIEATFRIRGSEGKADRDVRYIIGIKSVMHLIRTQDLSDDLRELVTGKIKSLQKVRYKTGEINFMDYFFNLKGLKNDAAKHINYNKRWLNTLKRLADYSQQNGSYMKKPIEWFTDQKNPPIPNGTLVLAQPDVTTLTNQTGIDLSIVSNAKRLAKNLFLIAIVIVDSSAGTMRVLFTDSDNDWDVQSLAAIDTEVAKTDNSQLMKELNRMVNR